MIVIQSLRNNILREEQTTEGGGAGQEKTTQIV